MITNYIADLMVKPGKSPVLGSPADFGLEYEDVTFKAEDGVELSGWLVKGGTDKIIVQSHFGVQCSRSGYTPREKGMIKMWDTDIEFLNQAKYLADAGYSVLMYDFRNHGNSEVSPRPWVTWGPEEAKDIKAAVKYVSEHPDYEDADIGLLSICMGASATTLAYGEDGGLQDFPNIKAMIAVQPLTYEKFVKAMGIPKFLVKRSNKPIQERTGHDFSKNTFMPNVKNINVPTLVIQNTNDPWTDLDMVKEYHQKLNVKKELYMVDLEKKRAAGYDWIGKNPEKILGWFGEYVK
ncbi:MAG: alpha/beta hydrolase [Okeania sp. SIO3B3]|nr:alpha/beta hydrolase [Okeania sp. SIO3B3]